MNSEEGKNMRSNIEALSFAIAEACGIDLVGAKVVRLEYSHTVGELPELTLTHHVWDPDVKKLGKAIEKFQVELKPVDTPEAEAAV